MKEDALVTLLRRTFLLQALTNGAVIVSLAGLPKGFLILSAAISLAIALILYWVLSVE